jgi:HAD superfamily hydrolase (TIGR01549 family)
MQRLVPHVNGSDISDYDAYIFDWDGTLGQTLGMWLQIVRDTLATYHFQLADKDIVRRIFGRAKLGLPEAGVPEADLEKIFSVWDTRAQAQTPSVPLYPGVAEVLAGLKHKGKKLAVVSATVRPTIQKALDVHDLGNVFHVVITGSDRFPNKPDPASILAVLEHLGVPKHRALMLGDSEKDIRAAQNAGIDSLLFFPPEHAIFHTHAELLADKPTYTIHAWQELLDQLQ